MSDNFLPDHLLADLDQPDIHALNLAARRDADEAIQHHIKIFEQHRLLVSLEKAKRHTLLLIDIGIHLHKIVRDGVYTHITLTEDAIEAPPEVAALEQDDPILNTQSPISTTEVPQ